MGKTSIQRSYFGKSFNHNYLPSLGVDFAVKKTKNYILQIWDMAGQSNYQKLREQYFKGAHGVILVFDITNSKTLENIGFWIEEVDKNTENKVPICIVGNKIDLRTELNNYIQESMVKTALMPLEEMYGVSPMYIETSALTGVNIDLLFETILGQIIEFNFAEFAI